jgi:Spy/CpxP family protein refolding chaperone
MRPQVKSTILFSVLGLSLALNAAMAIGYLRGSAEQTNDSTDRLTGGGYCLLDRLELDTEQQRRLTEMRREMRKRRAAYWQRAGDIKSELAEAICKAPVDRTALDAQLERYTRNQAMMQRAVAEHLLGVNTMLRAEQREAFRTLLRTEMFRGIRSARGKSAGVP